MDHGQRSAPVKICQTGKPGMEPEVSIQIQGAEGLSRWRDPDIGPQPTVIRITEGYDHIQAVCASSQEHNQEDGR
jgi:hypothetical protein